MNIFHSLIPDIRLSSDNRLLCIDYHSYLAVWDTITNTLIFHKTIESDNYEAGFLSSDELFISFHNSVVIFNLCNPAISREIKSVLGQPLNWSENKFCFNEKGIILYNKPHLLLLATEDYSEFFVKTSVKTGDNNELLDGPCVFSDDGNQFYFNIFDVAGGRLSPKIWDIRQNTIKTGDYEPIPTVTPRFSPDGKLVASGTFGGINIIQSDRMQIFKQLNSNDEKADQSLIQDYCFADNGKILYFAGGRMILQDVYSEEVYFIRDFGTVSLKNLEFSPEKQICYYTHQCVLHLYSIQNIQQIGRLMIFPDAGWLMWDENGHYRHSGFLTKEVKNTIT